MALYASLWTTHITLYTSLWTTHITLYTSLWKIHTAINIASYIQKKRDLVYKNSIFFI